MYTINIDMGAADGDRHGCVVGSSSHGWTPLQGRTGAIVLVPMLAKCERNHETRTLLSPAVIMETPRESWQTVKCEHCKCKVKLKVDYARIMGKT